MIKIALVGLGLVAELAHLPSFHKNKKVRIIALCDLDKKKLKKFSKKYKIKKIYTSYRKLIIENKLDGVVITVNKEVITKVAKEFLMSGIPVFSEKPVALSYKKADELNKLTLKKKIGFMIGYMKKFDDGILKLKKVIKKNSMGILNSVYYENFEGNSYKNPSLKLIKKKISVRRNKKYYYIKYLNSFCHSINLMRDLFGNIVLKSSRLNNIGEGIVIFKSNIINIIFNNKYSKINGWHEKIHLNYEKGKIIVNMPPPLQKNTSATITIKNYNTNTTKALYINKNGWSFENQANAFIKLIERKKINKSQNSIIESLMDIQIIEKIFNIKR